MRNRIFCPEIEACVISRLFDGRRLAMTMTDVFLVFDSLASVPLVLRFYSIRLFYPSDQHQSSLSKSATKVIRFKACWALRNQSVY